MKTLMLLAAPLLLCGLSAHAQQHRCLNGEGQVVTSKWTCSDLGLHRAPDAVARAPGSRNCLDPSALLSLEMDTKSVGISGAERYVRRENYARARNCQPLLSEFQKDDLRNQYGAGYQARGRQRSSNVTAAAGDVGVAGAPSPAAPSGAIDVRTGQYMPGVAGGVIDPRNGTFHQDVGGGYVNSRTGQFSPKH
jgi:hypothetical protein